MNEYSKSFRDAKRDAAFQIELDPKNGTNPESPDYKHPAYKDLTERMDIMRACAGGTETMRAKRVKFLPMMAREKEDAYLDRLRCAVAYNAVQRTTSGLAGMVFRKDMIVEADDQTLADLDDVDLLGNDVQVFSRRLLENALRDGYGWLVVDAPSTPVNSRAEEIALNVRPYWVHVDPADAINWQYQIVNGQPRLSLFTYREMHTRPVGTFGQETVECYRILRPGRFELWEKKQVKGKTSFILLDEGETDIPEVPVVYVPTLGRTPEDAKPPLMDIAYHQIAHFRRYSLYDAALDYAVPMPVVIGIGAENIEWGANRVLAIPDAEGDAKYLEMTGAALEQNRTQLEDLKHQMATLGLSMLSRDTRAAETAKSKQIDKSESDASLSVIAKAFESALNQALYFHSLYRRSEPGRVTVNRDFMAARLDAQSIQVLSQMVALGQLSQETLWQTLIAGEVLPDEFDPEVEATMLEAGEIM